MFISCEYKNYLGEKNGMDIWEYELTDSEFGTVLGIFSDDFSYNMFEMAIIQEYSERNLNVAANLAIAFVWYNKLNPDLSIQHLIDENKEYNPFFKQYEEDIQKYLLLL
jgi:hypothetical protein